MTKETPETYLYWLKATTKGAFCIFREFEAAVEALKALLWALLLFHMRLLILLTFPVSVPLIAYLCLKLNKKAILVRQKALKEIEESRYSLAQKLED